MKTGTHYIVVYILLLSYMFLGVMGHFGALTVYGFGTKPQNFVQAKTSNSSAAKAYWTQYKHIPSSIKISAPSPLIFTPPEVNQLHVFGIMCHQEAIQHYVNPVVLLHSCRAPPSA